MNVTKLSKIIDLANGNERTRVNSEWIQLESTEDILVECREQSNTHRVYYELKKGTPAQFAGTYVHELLLPYFIIWLDPIYAMHVMIMINKHKQDLNHGQIQLKNKTIEILSGDVLTLTERNREISDYVEQSRMRELQMQVSLGEIQEYLQDLIKISNRTYRFGVLLYLITLSGPYIYMIIMDSLE